MRRLEESFLKMEITATSGTNHELTPLTSSILTECFQVAQFYDQLGIEPCHAFLVTGPSGIGKTHAIEYVFHIKKLL
jgi:ATP-dependent 26S proteasome regulatory subunit